jgi:hypothetical protein
MSEQDRIEGQDEVEAHKHRHGAEPSGSPLASADESEGDKDDFELHKHRHGNDPQGTQPLASADESEGDKDDFELHGTQQFRPQGF